MLNKISLKRKEDFVEIWSIDCETKEEEKNHKILFKELSLDFFELGYAEQYLSVSRVE